MPRTILLVEDTDDTRQLIKLMLEMLGCRVIEAVDGQQAVEIAHKDEFDLVLMDLAMPNMDGITATKQLKQLDKTAQIPIVAITAHTDKYQTEALRAGVAEVVPKPVEMNDLKPLLSVYLGA